MVARQVWPLQVWRSGTNENSLPANDNSLAVQVVADSAIDFADSEPVTPSEDDQYVIGTEWGGFTENNVVIYKSGTWIEFEAFEGWVKSIDGVLSSYDGVNWVSGGGGGGIPDAPSDGTTYGRKDGDWEPVASNAPNVQSVTSSSTVTPTFANDLVKITAQAAALVLANPSGTAIDGWGIVIRIKDNGTARAISYGTQYRAIGVTLPTTTVVSKTLYIAGIWNVEDTTLDVLAVGQQA